MHNRLVVLIMAVVFAACGEVPTELAPMDPTADAPRFSHVSGTPTLNPDNGHYYLLVQQNVTYADAKAAAEATSYQGVQGHLATITSADENSFVTSLINHSDLGWVWLGGHQANTCEPVAAAGWSWVTGEAWSYTNWAGGEPNDWQSNCESLLVIYGGGTSSPGTWNDVGNNHSVYGTPSAPYVVEYDVPASQVFTSDPSAVQAWGPILGQVANWSTAACTPTPLVGLNDSRWGSPVPSYSVGPAAFETWTNWAGFSAPWINAWNSLFARDAPGAQHGDGTHSWAKFASTVSGQGDYVVQFLADNCSWIYLDGALIGFQGVNWWWDPAVDGRYSLTLSGTHTLEFIIFDGGGQAGGKFRLETLQSYVDGGGDPGNVTPPVATDNTPPVIAPTVSGTLGDNGWYTSDVSVSWTVTDDESDVSSTEGCEATDVTADTEGVTFTCTATSAGGTASESVDIKRDATDPTVTYSGNAGSYDVAEFVGITCEATDNLSGIASHSCADLSGAAYTFGLGTTAFSASAEDAAGNTGSAAGSFDVTASLDGLCTLVQRFVSHRGVANSLCAKTKAAANARNDKAHDGALRAFINEVEAQSGKKIDAADAGVLITIANALIG